MPIGPRERQFAELEADLVRLCGHRAALAFFNAFAGRRARIPQTVAADSEFARTIGLEAAQAFANEYGGETIDVPMGPLSQSNAITSAIREYLLQGLQVREITQLVRCSERAVRKARQRLREQGLLL